jgi:hypothetical protein
VIATFKRLSSTKKPREPYNDGLSLDLTQLNTIISFSLP